MYKYYIPHKLKVGDITHLADNDSQFAISNGIREEDFVTLQAANGIFLAQVTFVEKGSVEVEVYRVEELTEDDSKKITIIQSVSSKSKFPVFLEKVTEIGVNTVIPVISEYSLLDEKKAYKDFGLWKKVIIDACEQSRNPYPPTLEKITELSLVLSKIENEALKLCFVTEDVSPIQLSEITGIKDNDIVIAFGPESGWSKNDINLFKSNNFTFIRLKGNILRTETTPIVATSIIKFIQGEL